MGYKENMGHSEQTWEHGETALDKILIRGGNMAVLKRLKEHRDCCEYIDIVCSKGCGLKLPQKDIEEHLISCDGQRKQNKKDMGSEDEFSEEELQLPQSRPGPEGESSKVVKADRKDSSASGSISNSINDSLKLCKFNKLGCAFKGNRFELDLHMDIASEKHLDILCKSIQDIKSDYIKKENKIIAKHDKQIKTLQEYITKQNIIIKDLHETNKLLESTTNSNRKFVKELTQQCDVFNQEVARLKVQLNTFQEENIDSVRTNYTGSMIWKINNVAEHIKSAIEKSEFSIFSPIFYTSKSGYKLRAQIFLNGVGKYFGEYVSIFLHVLPSEYDPILKWPFLHKVTFTLFQQKDNMDTASHVTFTLAPSEKEESFQKPKECQMNDGKGSSQFVSLEKLHKDMFIKNNAMFIKIKVHCKSPTCRKDSHM